MQLSADLLHPSRRKADDDDVRRHVERRFVAGAGHVCIDAGHVREGAVKLHVPHLAARGTRHRLRRPDLVADHVGQRRQRHLHLASAETLEIRKSRMGADAYAAFDSRAHRRGHGVRIARVESAGDIGGCHDLKEIGVIAHVPRAEAFSHVRVQVNAESHGAR